MTFGRGEQVVTDVHPRWGRVHTGPRGREARAETIRQYKLERGCADCGYNAHAAALDFDHVRGIKLFNLNRVACRSWEAIWEEVEKCEVVCANCHRVRTQERARQSASAQAE